MNRMPYDEERGEEPFSWLEENETLKSIWEHLEELSIRLRRILIAIAIAAVISAAVPLEAIQSILAPLHIALPGLSNPVYHPNVTHANNTLEYILTHASQLACNVTRVVDQGNSTIVTLHCIGLRRHNSTAATGSGEGAAFLEFIKHTFHIKSFKWTPLIVKLPEILVSLTIPRYVYARGHRYPVYIMPVDTWEAFQIIIYSALLLGVLLASPIIVREIWAYIEPALYPHEKRLIKRYAVAFLGLFLAGVFLAVFLIAPLAYRVTLMLYPYFVPPDYPVLIRVSVAEVLSFIVELALATGAVFEIPIILYILIVNDVIAYETVKNNLKYVLLAALIIGAILSPDPSGIGMLIIAFTLYAPIHIATWLAGRAVRKKRSQAKVVEEVWAKAESRAE